MSLHPSPKGSGFRDKMFYKFMEIFENMISNRRVVSFKNFADNYDRVFNNKVRPTQLLWDWDRDDYDRISMTEDGLEELYHQSEDVLSSPWIFSVAIFAIDYALDGHLEDEECIDDIINITLDEGYQKILNRVLRYGDEDDYFYIASTFAYDIEQGYKRLSQIWTGNPAK